jgi:transcriptional regulator with XRE-family HTH domain
MRKSKQHNNVLLTHLGDALRGRRVDINVTQQELATATKLHRTYITDIESGHRNLSMLTYDKLTQALRCALSVPMMDAERTMRRGPAASLYGKKGALSKSSRLLQSSSDFFPNLEIDSLELVVKAAMSNLQLAVETFAQKHKRYPRNESELRECLCGKLPVNPFTQKAECPSIGTAVDEEYATRVSCVLEPGQIEYSPMNKGANYIIRGGAANGKALPGPAPGSTYVLSGNLRSYNQP